MRLFVSNLTAAMLLIHSLIGCCWHHGHACAERQETVAIHADCCHDHDGESHDDNEAPARHHNCELKCQGVCTYLPTQKIVIDAQQLLNSIDYVAVVLATANSYSASAASFWERSRVTRASKPPLRLHLLHQVILV